MLIPRFYREVISNLHANGVPLYSAPFFLSHQMIGVTVSGIHTHVHMITNLNKKFNGNGYHRLPRPAELLRLSSKICILNARPLTFPPISCETKRIQTGLIKDLSSEIRRRRDGCPIKSHVDEHRLRSGSSAIIMFVVPCSLKSSLRSQPRLAIRWFRSTPRRAEQFLDANEEVHITTVRVDLYRVFFLLVPLVLQTFKKVALNTASKEKMVLVDFYAE
jgi:hypothetical protein